MPDKEEQSVIQGLGFRPEDEGDVSFDAPEREAAEPEEVEPQIDASADTESAPQEAAEEAPERVSLVDSLNQISGQPQGEAAADDNYWRQKAEQAEREKERLYQQLIERADKGLLGQQRETAPEEPEEIDWQGSPELVRIYEEQGFEPEQAKIAARLAGLTAETATKQALRQFESKRVKPLEQQLSEFREAAQKHTATSTIKNNWAAAVQQLEAMNDDTRELVADLRARGGESFLGKVWMESTDAQRSAAHAVALGVGLAQLARMRSGRPAASAPGNGTVTSALTETASRRDREPNNQKLTAEQRIAAEMVSVRSDQLGELGELFKEDNWS